MEFISGFVIGILGSVHCAGMCGPLALALPVAQGGRLHFVVGRLSYNLGRVITYALLGVAVGFVGKQLFMAGAQQAVSIVLGVLLLIGALAPAWLRRVPTGGLLAERIAGPVKRAIGKLLHQSSVLSLLLLGVVNGILPCGLVYVALAAAATTGSAVKGIFFMVGFGIGTIPVMFLISLAGKQIQGGFRKRLAALMPVLTALIAVLIILRGMNLGIPYISPHVAEEPAQGEQVDCCH